MPALNIIAIQETVRNSGASSSWPSGMRPYRLTASHSAKTTKPLAASTNAQPPPVMMPPSTVVATALSESVPNTPQAMNARTSTAATPNTVRSTTGDSGCGRAESAGSDTEGGSAGSAGVGSFARCSVMVGGPDEPGAFPPSRR